MARCAVRDRGAQYEIEVRNPGRTSKGVVEVRLDGTPVEGNLLPLFPGGETHRVSVLMG